MNLTGLWVAMAFLTRLPTPQAAYNDPSVRASLAWYPVVGLLLGVLLGGFAMIVRALFPDAPLLGGVLLVAFWVALTGALHLDGLADTVDAWVGGLGDRERTLAIMKDPHVGASAVVWLCLFLGAKIAAVTALPANNDAPAALLLATVWSRLSPLWLFRLTPYVRAQGLGRALVNAVERPTLWLLTGCTVALSLLFVAWVQVLTLVVVLTTLFLLYRYWLLQRLGGTTGDTAGALIEITELTCLMTLLATAP